MTDNSRAKTHLKQTETKLNDLSNVSDINRIVAARSLDLFTNLSTGNNLFVDDEVKTDIQNIRDRLQIGAIVTDAVNEIHDLNTEEAVLPAVASSATRRADIGRQRSEFLRIAGGTRVAPGGGSANILSRQTEYNNLSIYANYFNTGSRMANVDLDITTVPGAARAGIANVNQNLDALFKTAPGNPNANYTLCDDQGNPLPVSGGNYTIQIGGQTATISGITLGARTLDLTGLVVTPPTVDLSQALKLSINASYSAATIGVNNVNLVCNKKFELQLRNGPAPINVNNPALRQTEIDNYNTTAPGNIVANEVNTQYNNHLASLQREKVFEALRHLDGTRFSQLEDYGRKNGKEKEIKEELYQQIYRNFLNTGVISPHIAGINDYNNFRNWFADDSRTWNTDPNVIRDAATYQNYVHNNLNTGVNDYMKDQLNCLLVTNHTNNMRLKTELSSFLTAIEQRRNDDEEVAGRRSNQVVEANIGNNDLMRKYRRGRVLGIPFGRPDVNYMRFYNGATHEIKDQSVDISTNSNIHDLNNPEPVKYDLKTTISGKNSISVTLDFPENDNRYRQKTLTLKQGEVSTLARKILNCPEIPDFKVRTHIVYNMLVSMIQISKNKNLGLSYRVPGTNHQREILMNGKNISLQQWDDVGGTRTETPLFDYDSFVTTNTFHGMGNSRSLQTGIDELMNHFNFAMNQYHENYRNATRSRLLKTKVSANSFWTSPLKTIRNLRTVRQFDFDTQVGDVEIRFAKNNITLKKGEIEISGKNLGKLLNYRKNKIRIFDGMEREIIGAFYAELIKKLRENSKINRSNFAVRDPLTQNIYVLDEDGEFGIVKPEDPGNILGGRQHRIIRKTELDAVDARGGRIMCSEDQTKEIFMNPMLMGHMIKAMNRRM